MHHMGITLDDKLLGDLDRARGGDPTDVVTAKVNEHQVFRTLWGLP